MRIAILLSIVSMLFLVGGHGFAQDTTFASDFPKAVDTREFSSLEEAKAFIMSAQSELPRSINKTLGKGLGARLIVQEGQLPPFEKVVVAHWFVARTKTGSVIDIQDATGDLEHRLTGAISVYSGFVVFSQDRQFSLSSFYIPDGYRYNNNVNPSSFRFGKVTYKADYPIGWGVNEGFQYLAKEID